MNPPSHVHHDSPPGDQRLKGKVAIITGGARGIGAATAKLFSRHGARVIIADILDDAGRSLADSISAHYIHCDVSNEPDVESTVQLALTLHGRVDVMFSNAGVAGPDGSITELSMEKMRDVLGVNIGGMVHCIKHAAKAMAAGGGTGGSIVCTSSTAAMVGGLAAHPYSLSKGAILGLMRSAACELGGCGIRVNCISPHGVPSEMLVRGFRRALGREDLGAEEVERLVAEGGSAIRGRGGRVEDVAEAALFLAGDEAGFVTGQNLVVDGGFTTTHARAAMSFLYQ